MYKYLIKVGFKNGNIIFLSRSYMNDWDMLDDVLTEFTGVRRAEAVSKRRLH